MIEYHVLQTQVHRISVLTGRRNRISACISMGRSFDDEEDFGLVQSMPKSLIKELQTLIQNPLIVLLLLVFISLGTSTEF